MKKIVFFLIFLSFILTACSETTSIYGTLTNIEGNTFFVECTDYVDKKEDSMTDVGYICTVQITDNTTLKKQSGENISVEDFIEGTTVQVTLTHPSTIGSSENSRDVEAKEVILFEE